MEHNRQEQGAAQANGIAMRRLTPGASHIGSGCMAVRLFLGQHVYAVIKPLTRAAGRQNKQVAVADLGRDGA